MICFRKLIYKVITFVFLIVIVNGNLFAQDTLSLKLNFSYLKNIPVQTGKIFSYPVNWGGKEYLKAGAFASMFTLIYLNDENIKNWFQKNRTNTTNQISYLGRMFGDWEMFSVMGMYGLYGYFSDNKWMNQTTLLTLESIIISQLFTNTLKYTFHRHRPYTGNPYNTFDGPGFKTNSDFLSFASGHSTAAFSILTMIALNYNHKYKWFPYLSGILATSTALSRIHDNKHWASDVFIGGLIGYYTSVLVYDLNKKK